MTSKTNAQKIQDWRDANPGTRLNESTLRGLIGTNLRGADLARADLRGANLWGADLAGADLWGADLWGANLRGADLARADLRGANLWGANLAGANLAGADLAGADLWGGFRLDGLRSGQVTMVPTAGGWRLRVGCWSGTVDELETLASGDEDWPEAVGEEREKRRPGLLALIPLLRAHQEYYHDKLVAVQEKWGNDND